MPIYLESTLKDNQKDIKERAEFEDQKDAIFKLRNKSFVRVELTKDIQANREINFDERAKTFKKYLDDEDKVTLYKGESGHINDDLNKISIGGIVAYVEPGDFKIKDSCLYRAWRL